MRGAWSWFAASSVLTLLATSVDAGTVLERDVRVAVRGDGTVAETLRLRVRIDDEDDAVSWSVYQVALYDNRVLERLDARVVHPDGRVVPLAPEDQETLDGSAGGLFHASLRLHRARFHGLRPGAVVEIDEAVTARPHYPAGRVLLRGGGPIASLRVEVDAGGAPGWRWHLEGPAAGLTVAERDGGVVVTATDLPALEVPELAPVGGAVHPVLRYGWGTDGTWQHVGRWYRDLAASVPRADGEVGAQARALTAGLATPRARLDALALFLQDKVRNVAVLIGDGNYRPSPPAEVLARKWGDCKDKSVLLVDLLAAAGVEAYPALVNKDARRRTDLAFPTPEVFNHAVVAVPTAAVAVGPDDPAAGGYLFLDVTQAQGVGRWLDPDAQDQDALVLRADGAELVRTPLRPDLESRHLAVDAAVDPAGDARGRARLAIRGELAYELLGAFADLGSTQAAEQARSLLARLLPGAEIAGVGWTTASDAVPALEVTAAVVLPGLVEGAGERRSLRLPGMRATPDPRLLRDRTVPAAVPARAARTTWSLTLPADACLPPPGDEELTNDAGLLRWTVASDEAGRLILDRRVEVRRRWINPEGLPALAELAQAEHRLDRRRVRLRCGGTLTPNPLSQEERRLNP